MDGEEVEEGIADKRAKSKSWKKLGPQRNLFSLENFYGFSGFQMGDFWTGHSKGGWVG